ncbi:unnamed protein product [Trichobilharzia szidati]|nr:unnamed protein product [Trichobilharzia szidati]
MFAISKFSFVILITLFISQPWITLVINAVPALNTNEQSITYPGLQNPRAEVFFTEPTRESEELFRKHYYYPNLSTDRRLFRKRAAYIDLPWGK